MPGCSLVWKNRRGTDRSSYLSCKRIPRISMVLLDHDQRRIPSLSWMQEGVWWQGFSWSFYKGDDCFGKVLNEPHGSDWMDWKASWASQKVESGRDVSWSCWSVAYGLFFVPGSNDSTIRYGTAVYKRRAYCRNHWGLRGEYL